MALVRKSVTKPKQGRNVIPTTTELMKRGRGRPKHTDQATRCQHHNQFHGTQCKMEAVGTIELPGDYDPGYTPKVSPYKMPRSGVLRVCAMHMRRIETWGQVDAPRGGTHQMWCLVCANPRHEYILKQWVGWRLTSPMAILELDVPAQSFYAHVRYFKLDEKRASKDMRKRFLQDLMEKGAAAGDHSVNTALKASDQLNKLMGDTAEKHEHSVTATVIHGHLDLTKMGADELRALIAQLNEQLATQLQQLPADVGGEVIDLPTGHGDAVIDLPATAVRRVAAATADDED